MVRMEHFLVVGAQTLTANVV
ncbi:protein of unknown function [Pseudomonas sp. JV241A]|nr:protein of unknown function [Pseudomonas sp. JV241A]